MNRPKKKYKWGAESVVTNRKGKEVPDALNWENVQLVISGKPIEGIVPVDYTNEPVAFDDHLRL